MQDSLRNCGEFRYHCFGQLRGSGAGGGELRFQLVHQGHQLIDFGHDPALFGEGWEWEGISGNNPA